MSRAGRKGVARRIKFKPFLILLWEMKDHWQIKWTCWEHKLGNTGNMGKYYCGFYQTMTAGTYFGLHTSLASSYKQKTHCRLGGMRKIGGIPVLVNIRWCNWIFYCEGKSVNPDYETDVLWIFVQVEPCYLPFYCWWFLEIYKCAILLVCHAKSIVYAEK